MRRSRRALRGLVVATVACCVVAVGSQSPLTAKARPKPTLARTTVEGAGSTFQLNYTQTVIGAFRQREPAVTMRYVGLGSPRAVDDLAHHKIDFVGIDSPLAPEAGTGSTSGPYLSFPMVVAPIVLAYNVPDVSDLRLSAATIAEIFQGDITRWNAPEIASENPDLTLPDLPIVAAHRTERSGTTTNVTSFLVRQAPFTWRLGSGPTVRWPQNSSGGAGNFGVAQIVKTTPGAIGYVDYANASALILDMASVKNANGEYVAPSLDSASAALAATVVNDDLTFDPINSPGRGAYPITVGSWLVVYEHQADPAKAAALRALLRFIYTGGQPLAKTTSYAALPASLVKLARARIRRVAVIAPD
jgi:phosphate transport system substrate-binding protein